MEKISYKLDVFEGPMDLLLHLISKHKLNIYDIPIVTLVEQYVEYVRQMQEEDMYVASEFLEMAARLVYLKSVSLLPVHTEAEELKSELQGELIEYRDMKAMAEKLSENTEGFSTFIRKQEKIEIDYIQKKHVKKPGGGKPGFVVYYTNYSLMIDSDISNIELISG